MKKLPVVSCWLLVLLLIGGCKKVFIDEDMANNPRENFDYLWNDIKNRYSFLEYKGLNWDEVYDSLSPKIKDGMSSIELFNVLATMMNTLRDGHVNLTSWFNVSNYFPIFLGSPQNYDSRLVLEHYLLRVPSRYYVTGGLQHTVIDTLGVRVGYIRYSSFLNTVHDYDISFVIDRFLADSCDGVIIDVRNNGGGDVGNVFPLVIISPTRRGSLIIPKLKPGRATISVTARMCISIPLLLLFSPGVLPCSPTEIHTAQHHCLPWR